MLLLIGLCGVCGACLRYAIGDWLRRIYKGKFPLATLLINWLGSLMLGYIYKRFELGYIDLPIWNMLGIGFLGAFTTFSTFSFEGISLWLNKKYGLAITYLFATILFGFLLALLGYWSG